MTIGELAGRAGVGVQTVRYYERRSLLPPPDRTPAGYREYGEEDLRRLRFILRAKELGFTLSEVGELLELRVAPGRTAADVRTRALRKIEDTRARVRDLRRILRALEALVSTCEAHGPPDRCALMHAIDPGEGAHGDGTS